MVLYNPCKTLSKFCGLYQKYIVIKPKQGSALCYCKVYTPTDDLMVTSDNKSYTQQCLGISGKRMNEKSHRREPHLSRFSLEAHKPPKHQNNYALYLLG